MSVALGLASTSAASVFGAVHTAVAANAAPTSTATTTSSTVDSSTITSSDFMTLLVTEMKNQDPTQPTDPTTYVQQLVGVNSLQQLIGINSGVSTLNGTTSSTTSGTSGVSGH